MENCVLDPKFSSPTKPCIIYRVSLIPFTTSPTNTLHVTNAYCVNSDDRHAISKTWLGRDPST